MKSRKFSAGLMAAVAVTGVAATSANAATKAKPKPLCDLVTDPTGDATGFLLVNGVLPNEPGLDITSADIATNATTLEAVVRVANLSSTATAPTGRTFYVNFTIGSTNLFLHGDTGNVGGFGSFSSTGLRSDFTAPVKVVFDNAKNEVRMSVPLDSVKAHATGVVPGAKITKINALAQRQINAVVVSVTPTADDTSDGKDYPIGAPSCVKVSANP